ncbi:MAG TPA: hypothetical protein VK191_08615 [Symbiobacteriaceae bacterium]|nr:hypothetical protein [Symbiobacteriaceae bacterium]
MSDFTSAPLGVGALDPQKRLRYSLGLILGEDELAQEQFYFLERGRLHNRALHGYGTVSGLALQVKPGESKVTVTPGLAVDPFGREIKVTPAQCADLAQWLDAQGLDALPATVYVLLNYKECETDKMPVPGSACRSAADSLVPSRISESFQLSFSTVHPNQAEEELVKTFVAFLASIDVTTGRPPTEVQTLIEDLKKLFAPASGGATSDSILRPAPIFRPLPGASLKPSISGATPVLRTDLSATEVIRPTILPPLGPALHPAQAPLAIRELLRVWVTEIRPSVAPDASGAVLLGALHLSQDEAGQLKIAVDQAERPLLVASRVIQEALAHPEQNRTHTELYGLANDDHKQYLLVNPANRALVANLDASGHRLTNLAPATAGTDAPRLDQVMALVETRIQKQAAQRDLAGEYPTLTVIGLQGRDVAPTAPATGNVLTWNGSKWAPAAPPAGGGGGIDLATVAGSLPTLPFVTIREVPSPEPDLHRFQLWFHIQVDGDPTSANVAELTNVPEIQVWAETGDGSTAEPFLRSVYVKDAQLINRNVVELFTEKTEVPLLRFIINLESAGPGGRFLGTLNDWAKSRPVKWVGHDGVRTVTAFHVMGGAPATPTAGTQTIAAGYVSVKDPTAFRGFGIEQTWSDGWIYSVAIQEPLLASFPPDRWLVRVTVNAFGTNATPSSVSLDWGDPRMIRVPLSNPFDVNIDGFWIEVAAY